MTSKAKLIAWGIALAAVWFWTCRQLAVAWSLYPNYHFGYLVPWIVILLALRRIRATPRSLAFTPPRPSSAGWLAGLGIAAAWTLFVVAELGRQLDPNWRMVSWSMSAAATLLTCVGLWRTGGARLLKGLAFPLGFIWTAVPWPTKVEEVVMLKLRGLVTNVSVAALHATGVKALQHGNVIELVNGSVTVDSACSGISSFQASIMASLFLGEFFRFRAGRRLLLLAAGTLLAVAGNLVRATILVRVANDWGAAALLAYHDWVGYAETTGIFLALMFAAWRMSLRAAGPSRDKADPGTVTRAAEGTMLSSGPGRGARTGVLAGREGYAVLLAFASVPFLAWGWFALSPGGPIRNQETPLWALVQNSSASGGGVQPVALPPLDIRTLDYTEGQAVCLTGPFQTGAEVYHFFWKTEASLSGYVHTPDVCMLGAGWKLTGEPVNIRPRIRDAELPGKLYRFERDGSQTMVFQAIWYGGDPIFDARGPSRMSRLALLWNAPRRRGLEALNVYMRPAGTSADQTRAAEEIFAQVLIPAR